MVNNQVEIGSTTVATFEVENIKCGGCMSSIKKGLMEIDGVENVEVNNELGSVTITFHADTVETETLLQKLTSMGYPPVGENTLGRQARSFVSCAIGRITKDE